MSKIKNQWLETVPANTLKGNNDNIQNNVKDLTVSEIINMLNVITDAPIDDNLYIRKNAVWEQINQNEIYTPNILKPTITFPIDESININLTPTIQFTNYYSLYGKEQKSIQVVISTDLSFSTIIYDQTINSITNNITISSNLDSLTHYWIKGRYQDIDDNWSDWSDIISFTTTIETYIETPNILSPSNNAIDQLLTLTLSSNNFNCVNGTDTHESTDWEIYDDSSLTNLIWSSINDNINLEHITINTSVLDLNTTYYVRVRYTGLTYGNSNYSSVNSFTTGYIEQPNIIFPSNGTTNVSTTANIIGNSFNNIDDTHEKSDWEVASDTNFNNLVFSSYDDINNLESITLNNINSNTPYYVRLRYYGTLFGWSDWSGIIHFTTADIYIDTPVNQSPINGAININETPVLSTNNFNCVNGTDTHESTDWEIYDDSSLTNLIWSSINDNINLESIYINTGILSSNETYYFRCRYKGVINSYSDWSTATNFTTNSVFCSAYDPTVFNEGVGSICNMLDYDPTTDTGFYGYVGCGNEDTYNSSITYNKGTIINNGSNHFYYSKIDSNLNNVLPPIGGENSNWKWIGSGILINGFDLSADIGLVSGTLFNINCGWLKFFIGSSANCNIDNTDKVIYVSRKTIRYDLSWEDIYNSGAIYGTGDIGTSPPGPGNSGKVTQDAQVTYNSDTYIVRVLTGSENDPASEGFNNHQCVDNVGNNSEWNDLIYRVHVDSPTCLDISIGQYNNTNVRHGGSQDGNNWMNFTNTDLQIYNTVSGDGTGSFCQEQGNDTNRRVYRGEYGVADFYTWPESDSFPYCGWRPVLELIQ